ncbi:MAG: antibiotic biosynthesis monooxygenase [Sedimentisphaerales bacterium]|nr:antibiotic biosynthesis monooxygenase [Sedimentisphaerales bacterium]
MFIVHVHVQVKPEFVEDFKEASIENAQNSIKEPAIVRFDVIQQEDDSEKFILVEAYLNADGVIAHKQTAHYNKWQKTVEDMVIGQRTKTKFVPIWPEKY